MSSKFGYKVGGTGEGAQGGAGGGDRVGAGAGGVA